MLNYCIGEKTLSDIEDAYRASAKEKGFLYYLGKDGNVWRSGMSRGGSGGGNAEKVADAGVKRESGFLYFIDKDGDVSRAPMARGRG